MTESNLSQNDYYSDTWDLRTGTWRVEISPLFLHVQDQCQDHFLDPFSDHSLTPGTVADNP